MIEADGKPLLIYSEQQKVAAEPARPSVRRVSRSAFRVAAAAGVRSSLQFDALEPSRSASRKRGLNVRTSRSARRPDHAAAAAAARRGGVPAHGDPAVRRPPEVDQGDGNGDGSGQSDPAGRAEVRRQGRSRARRHVRDRLRLQHPADAEAARRHGESAGRGRQRARTRTASSTTATHCVAEVDAGRRPRRDRSPRSRRCAARCSRRSTST